MPQRIHRNTLGLSLSANEVGANSLTLALTDPVSISAAGLLALTTAASDRIHGYSNHTGTLSATNQTVELVQPSYLTWWGVEVVYNTTTAPTASSRGTFVDFSSVVSGAITVVLADGTNSLTSTTRGQLHCLLNDPTSQSVNECVFEASEPQTLADGQAV